MSGNAIQAENNRNHSLRRHRGRSNGLYGHLLTCLKEIPKWNDRLKVTPWKQDNNVQKSRNQRGYNMKAWWYQSAHTLEHPAFVYNPCWLSATQPYAVRQWQNFGILAARDSLHLPCYCDSLIIQSYIAFIGGRRPNCRFVCKLVCLLCKVQFL